ncbi:MAG: hypothetical protein PWP72_2030 [Thermoanaerobacter sp.]|nr:hypothetical protein [Thermoanaerobacter sp.]
MSCMGLLLCSSLSLASLARERKSGTQNVFCVWNAGWSAPPGPLPEVGAGAEGAGNMSRAENGERGELHLEVEGVLYVLGGGAG